MVGTLKQEYGNNNDNILLIIKVSLDNIGNSNASMKYEHRMKGVIGKSIIKEDNYIQNY